MAETQTMTARSTPRLWRRLMVTLRRANFFAWLEAAAALSFVLMVGATYLAFSAAPESGLLPSVQVASLLIGTLIPALALVVLIGRRVANRRAAGSTARMHVRLVFFFSLVAAIPTLLVSAFAAILFQSGVDFWFSDDSRGLMRNANELAREYYEQNQLEVAEETTTMASDLRFYFDNTRQVSFTGREFVDFVNLQMQGRDINETAILQAIEDGSLRTVATYNLTQGSEPGRFGSAMVGQLRDGQGVVVQATEAKLEALAPIDLSSGVFLYNARNSEAISFNSWERAQDIAANYETLTKRARALQLRFNLALFFASIGLVGMAVWFALRFADRQVEPLTDLVAAAREVGAGNFAMRVEGRTGADEIGLLNRAFNRMTAQIERQTDALVGANRQLDDRRAFMETVLESVSAGVVSVDQEGRIQLMNGPAQSLLFGNEFPGHGPMMLADLAPQIAAMLEGPDESGIVSHSRGSDLLTLAVRATATTNGRVITFEDITRQLLDQRQAAWSDVARRIAHEIKNPLTPIQLATERLMRRYRKQIEQDGELFDELTSTIVRQVGDLRKMVDEFSSFARLPKPVFRPENALDLVRQAMFLQEVAHSQIDFKLSSDDDLSVTIMCDRHQVGQALTNVMKNAVEAVESRSRDAEPDYRGRIRVRVTADEDNFFVAIEDNGVGLPSDRERIVEPYVTTRDKGTGLGLAIVNKIVEEHGGEMAFSSAPEGGARVSLRFARDPARKKEAAE
ncbi:ATP-binding protein [Altererythrobacter sp. H2]|uniref:sensor histidine kinase n=1 Tax=Altererythrobacter sp. H2 TaxID=3108391 RepID=UPI002B4C1377|nr:ATP-binding protein [Altererythrobacter sp. H2]WRK94323.1 ATP-binding protein [Altererythrobacter sp. H2]